MLKWLRLRCSVSARILYYGGEAFNKQLELHRLLTKDAKPGRPFG